MIPRRAKGIKKMRKYLMKSPTILKSRTVGDFFDGVGEDRDIVFLSNGFFFYDSINLESNPACIFHQIIAGNTGSFSNRQV